MQSISPEELKELLDGDGAPRLIDVREPWELDICRIAGSENIPMSELGKRLDELDRERTTVIICHHGMRSGEVAAYLESIGFSSVANLEDGIDGWANSVDPDMPQY